MVRDGVQMPMPEEMSIRKASSSVFGTSSYGTCHVPPPTRVPPSVLSPRGVRRLARCRALSPMCCARCHSSSTVLMAGMLLRCGRWSSPPLGSCRVFPGPTWEPSTQRPMRIRAFPRGSQRAKREGEGGSIGCDRSRGESIELRKLRRSHKISYMDRSRRRAASPPPSRRTSKTSG